MNEHERPLPDDLESEGRRAPDADRRELLRRALGLGVFVAAGGPALGESLLVRAVAPLAPMPLCFEQTNPTTLTAGRSNTYTVGGQVTGTVTFSGIQTPPEPPGTFTTTEPPQTYYTATHTHSEPAPGGTTQPVTFAGTSIISYTPPVTNWDTVSWEGNSWTKTVYHSPSAFTATITESLSLTYTSTTTAKPQCPDDAPPPDSIEVRRTADDPAIENIDLLGVDIQDVHSRISQPQFLKLACGVAR
jgi:hypothetical protein